MTTSVWLILRVCNWMESINTNRPLHSYKHFPNFGSIKIPIRSNIVWYMTFAGIPFVYRGTSYWYQSSYPRVVRCTLMGSPTINWMWTVGRLYNTKSKPSLSIIHPLLHPMAYYRYYNKMYCLGTRCGRFHKVYRLISSTRLSLRDGWHVFMASATGSDTRDVFWSSNIDSIRIQRCERVPDVWMTTTRCIKVLTTSHVLSHPAMKTHWFFAHHYFQMGPSV